MQAQRKTELFVSPPGQVSVPAGSSPDGRVKIEEFVITEIGARVSNMRSIGVMHVEPGNYKRLRIGIYTVMTNTHMEVRTSRVLLHNATGNILINGLGLGMVVEELLTKPTVDHITVIEKDPDVIKLVSPVFEGNPRVTIIEACAFEYRPPKGVKYDFVWHDIWPFIAEQNLPEMTRLHRKYARRTVRQESWAKDLCQMLRDGFRI